jgi:hypothetical protein
MVPLHGTRPLTCGKRPPLRPRRSDGASEGGRWKLDDVKSEGIRDFQAGGLKGEGLLAGVVTLVNDTRSSLAARNGAPRPHGSHLDVELGDDRSAAGLR